MESKKVIFVNPSLSYDDKKYGEKVFPFASIMLLSTILKGSGYEVKIIDSNRYSTDDCLAEINKEIDNSTLYIGFSVMTSQVPWAYKVTKEIKKVFPNLCVIWGGTHPTLYPEGTIADDLIDIVVVNEACSTITKLTKAIKDDNGLYEIPGIYFKSEKKIVKTSDFLPDDIKAIPPINFSLFDVDFYSHDNMLSHLYNFNEKIISLPIITGLGCVYKCTFCINVILKRRYRFKTAEEIVDRIEYLQGVYGANFFQFLDEDFFISKKRIFDFLDLVEKKRLKFYFRPWLRVSYFRDDYISVDVAKRLERIGMITAVMGAECGSQAMLDKIEKQIKVEDTLRAAQTLSKTKIIPRFSFMVGLPGETKEDILATYRLALRLKKIDKRADIPILSFAVYPGSQLYNEAVKEYNLKEPTALSEWAKTDFSGYLGFYSAQGKPWIFNKKIFNRMGHYYNLGFRFTHREGKIYDYLHDILRAVIRLRFKLGQFNFSVEEWFLTFYRAVKSRHLFRGN